MSELLDTVLHEENISQEELLKRYLLLVNLIGARAIETHSDFEVAK